MEFKDYCAHDPNQGLYDTQKRRTISLIQCLLVVYRVLMPIDSRMFQSVNTKGLVVDPSNA